MSQPKNNFDRGRTSVGLTPTRRLQKIKPTFGTSEHSRNFITDDIKGK